MTRLSSNGLVDALRAEIVPIVANSDSRAFLVNIDAESKRQTVTVHCAHGVSKRSERSKLEKILRERKPGMAIRVKAHRARELERAKSLEDLVRSVSTGDIVYDPTGGFERSRRLAGFAARLREALDRKVAGVYWSAEWRTLYVVLDIKRYFASQKARIADLAGTEIAVWNMLRETCGESASDFVSSIRLGFEAPQGAVIPVDRKSYRVRPSALMRAARKAAAPALGAAFGLSAMNAAQAQEIKLPPEVMSGLPAVSAVNGKIAFFGGRAANEDLTDPGFSSALQPENRGFMRGVMGSLSIPLGHSFGVQFDGLMGSLNERSASGGGVHLFWRDPGVGLLGVIGSSTTLKQQIAVDNGFSSFLTDGDFHISRIGGEAEIYLNNFTIAATAGNQYVDADIPTNGQFNESNAEGFFGDIRLSWYASENLVFSVGAEQSPASDTAATFGVEYQPAFAGLSNMSLFFDGAYADEDQYRALAGVRFYIGESKSLMRRHREDDPQNNLVIGPASTGATSASTYFY
ncbi:MAG: hypothetical protein KDJ90_20465 [Nitratireductor sp.]|nr:hypothetical protein [Nitratireductor sp.]